MRTLLTLLLATTLQAQQTAPPREDLDAHGNSARNAVIRSLDTLAARQTAARRAEIARIHTLAQAQARQAKVRASMLRLIGPLPARTPLNPQLLGETTLPGLRIQKILFDSQPGFHVTALLYLPETVAPGTRLPALVVAPGHGASGKTTDFAFASLFARNGFAVLSYDPIGQGERLQYPDPASPGKSLAKQPTGEHSEASLQPILLGETLAGYMLWDGMRAVDLLQQRPEVDPARIGAFGCSGGGAMTALLGALDTRIQATGDACYITSFDTLLPSLGPQDGEQSTPGWLAGGLDFPDWIELAAPRPYAIISTESDMFPFAGAQATETEARAFYGLFSVPSQGSAGQSASSALAFIHGPGGHANLRPLQSRILAFFQTHLQNSGAAPLTAPSSDPEPPNPLLPPPATFQVTATGQVSTSYPGAATVFSLNLAHAGTLPRRQNLNLPQLQSAIRTLLAIPSAAPAGHFKPSLLPDSTATALLSPNTFSPSPPHAPHARFAAVLLLTGEPVDPPTQGTPFSSTQNRFHDLAEHGRLALLLGSRPDPPGQEAGKSPLLGPFYLLGLRAELTGRTLLGLRVEDVLQAVDVLASRPDVDPANISGEASGHQALVLLHAAVLDSRLKHITLSDLPPTYSEFLADPIPQNASEDLIPGVLLRYDVPDLLHALGSRVTVTH